MALFRKFFYRKPPEGLLEISERVYVFDYCFTTDVLEEGEYKVYIGGIVRQLRDHFPDASFMVFNFREGENQSQIAHILSEYDMTVMDYPRHYEGCPLLTMEMIHHFLRSSESWLSLGQQNVLLMHCERGGWPVLAFMLAALLIYRKQYTGEQKTLDMIYKQAPRELLQLMSPLNPLPSQLRYLQYVSRRNVGSEWPPLDRALTLDCVILRFIRNLDGEGGCRPIFRIYGQDPFMAADRTPKVLFSTPKRSKLIRHYKQVDCELVKIDIHCHIQGDVVLECISLDDDLEREAMMFRVMFNTAFIRSNILMLNRDEIDILWNAKDQFPKDFRAEILFSEMDSAASFISLDLPGVEEKEGLPVEAFAKVQEIFSNVDWLDPKTDAALNVIQQIAASNILQEKLDIGSLKSAEALTVLLESTPEKVKDKPKEKPELNASENIGSPTSMAQGKQYTPTIIPSLDANSIRKRIEPQELQVALQHPAQSKIISQRVPQTSLSGSEKVKEKPELKASENIGSPTSMAQGKQYTPTIIPSLDANSIRKKIEPQELQVTRQRPAQSKTISQRVPQTSLSAPEKVKEKPELKASENIGSPTSMAQGKQYTPAIILSLDANSIRKKIEPQELQAALQWPAQSKIISQRVPQNSLSAPASYCNSLQGSPVPISRYRSAPSALGITALLHDHAAFNREEVTHPVTISPPSPPTSSPSFSESVQTGYTSILPPPPSPPPPPLLQSSKALVTVKKAPASPHPPPPPQPTLEATESLLTQHPGTTLQGKGQPLSVPPSLTGESISPVVKSSLSTPPPPPPPPSFSGASSSPTFKSSLSTPPPPPPSFSGTHQSSTVCSVSAPPPPPPRIASSATSPVSSLLPMKDSAAMSGPPPPPPPPMHSRPASGPTITSSAQPPPPPPAKNSAHVPPVPPPPAPLANRLSKAGGASPQSHSLIPGPPPAAPLTTKGRGLSRPSPKNQAQPKKNNLKPYHWLKLTRAMQGSLWAEAPKSDEASKAPEFDMSELESLFSAAVPNSDHGSSGGKSNRRASGPKTEKVQLIDLRRAYNCEIMLTKVKIPLPDLMSSVLALDDSALDVDQVDNLIKFCPTKEEMELLKGYNGDKENLGKCEQFYLELMKVPRVESKLRVFSFKIQFHSQVSDLRVSLNVVNSVAEEIRNSAKLKRIMQTILSLGNALNHGTARGSAIGFRLDSLLKLTDTRARNKKMTLMHYLCKVLAEKLPELLDFPKDLVSLEASTKIQLKYLAEEMQAISKGLEKVVQELTASENDGPVSENFCKILKEFLGFGEAEVRSLASLYASVGRNADALALYFGEDPARCPFEQVVSTLLNFVRMFVRAREENCKQLEFEKKKAQKEAENEKVKVSTPRKESEHLMQTRIKSGNFN